MLTMIAGATNSDLFCHSIKARKTETLVLCKRKPGLAMGKAALSFKI